MAASMKKPVVVILGATGTGKTKLSLELARLFNGEIISADAMQVYKGLDIITNKATPEELKACPHHMIDFMSPLKENSTVIDFRNSALPIIDGLLGRQQLPVVVGGTLYYIESLLWKTLVDREIALIHGSPTCRMYGKVVPGFPDGAQAVINRAASKGTEKPAKIPKLEGIKRHRNELKDQTADSETVLLSPESGAGDEGDSSVKQRSGSDSEEEMHCDREKYEKYSNRELHKQLMDVDSTTARKMHPNNRRKIIRALEVYDRHGIAMSDVYKVQHADTGSEKALGGPVRYPHNCLFWLQCEKEVLEERLDKRVDTMISQGLVKELTNFHKQYNEQRIQDGKEADYTKGIFQSIGFKEFHDYLILDEKERQTENGQKMLEKGVEDLKTATRQYSRYQNKWIRKRFLKRSGDTTVPIYGLDCTDVSKWEEVVSRPAASILEALIKGETPPIDPLPYEGENNTEYEYNECKACDVVMVTQFEWKLHCGTKKHKAMYKRYKQKLSELSQTLDTHVTQQQISNNTEETTDKT